jgi:hypothetical protein
LASAYPRLTALTSVTYGSSGWLAGFVSAGSHDKQPAV